MAIYGQILNEDVILSKSGKDLKNKIKEDLKQLNKKFETGMFKRINTEYLNESFKIVSQYFNNTKCSQLIHVTGDYNYYTYTIYGIADNKYYMIDINLCNTGFQLPAFQFHEYDLEKHGIDKDIFEFAYSLLSKKIRMSVKQNTIRFATFEYASSNEIKLLEDIGDKIKEYCDKKGYNTSIKIPRGFSHIDIKISKKKKNNIKVPRVYHPRDHCFVIRYGTVYLNLRNL